MERETEKEKENKREREKSADNLQDRQSAKLPMLKGKGDAYWKLLHKNRPKRCTTCTCLPCIEIASSVFIRFTHTVIPWEYRSKRKPIFHCLFISILNIVFNLIFSLNATISYKTTHGYTLKN